MVIRVDKVIAALPPTLTPDTIYVVRAGAGFDLRVTDATGAVAHALNLPAGDGILSGTTTITVPSNALEHTQTVAAVGVVPGKRILIDLAPHTDADENHELWLDPMTLTALAGVDQIGINAAFSSPTSGPIKLNWSAF